MVNFDETSKIQVNLNSMQGQIGADFKIPLGNWIEPIFVEIISHFGGSASYSLENTGKILTKNSKKFRIFLY